MAKKNPEVDLNGNFLSISFHTGLKKMWTICFNLLVEILYL